MPLDDCATLAGNGSRDQGAEWNAMLAAPGPSVEDEASARADLALVAEVARGLTPAQRRPWGLHLAGASYREVAAAEGMSYTAVNRHLTEGRAKFRAALA